MHFAPSKIRAGAVRSDSRYRTCSDVTTCYCNRCSRPCEFTSKSDQATSARPATLKRQSQTESPTGWFLKRNMRDAILLLSEGGIVMSLLFYPSFDTKYSSGRYTRSTPFVDSAKPSQMATASSEQSVTSATSTERQRGEDSLVRRMRIVKPRPRPTPRLIARTCTGTAARLPAGSRNHPLAREQRVVILSAAAMGLLRKELNDTLGLEAARRLANSTRVRRWLSRRSEPSRAIRLDRSSRGSSSGCRVSDPRRNCSRGRPQGRA